MISIQNSVTVAALIVLVIMMSNESHFPFFTKCKFQQTKPFRIWNKNKKKNHQKVPSNFQSIRLKCYQHFMNKQVPSAFLFHESIRAKMNRQQTQRKDTSEMTLPIQLSVKKKIYSETKWKTKIISSNHRRPIHRINWLFW